MLGVPASDRRHLLFPTLCRPHCGSGWVVIRQLTDPLFPRQLVPLVVFFIFIGGLAFVGYQIYLGVNKIQAQATKNIGNKNITFTKDGMRVNVKEVKNEKYVDATQKVFVDVWNQHANNIGLDEQRKRYVQDSPLPALYIMVHILASSQFCQVCNVWARG